MGMIRALSFVKINEPENVLNKKIYEIYIPSEFSDMMMKLRRIEEMWKIFHMSNENCSGL